MPGTRERLVQSAEKHLSRGKLDQALKDYLDLLKTNPNDAFVLNKAGDLCVRMGRPADAIGHFSRIAESYSSDGFFLKAIAIFKKINKIDPTRLDIYERLAVLYTKQGLTQDARSHYLTLAEQSLKRNDIPGAISAFASIAATDPTDLKIQARLGDLHRVAGQTAEAVARYDAIAGMLQRSGAHEEALTFFRRALDLDPNDPGARMQIIRAYLTARDFPSAIAALRAAPENAETLILLGEAHLASDNRADATAAVERAIELEPDNAAARSLLAQIRVEEGSPDAALDAVSRLVDLASSSGDFARAASHLRPILEAFPSHRAALQKMAELSEAEADSSESIAMRLALGRDAEARGDVADDYRRVLSADPSQAFALSRLGEIAPSPREAAAPSEPEPLASPMSGTLRSDDAVAALQEAEVLARYGLKDRAIDRLRALARREPELLAARERLVELLAETGNPAARREADALAEVYRGAGHESLAVALFARINLPTALELDSVPATRQPLSAPPPPPSIDVEFDEFEITAPAESLRPQPAAFDFFEPEPPSETTRLTPHAGNETGFGVLAPELGSLIEEKMQRAAGKAVEAAPLGRHAVSDENLFADERQFFNLAEELERELSEETVAPPAAPDLAGTQDETSLQEIFREFRKGVEQQLSAEDYETHYNLGIAYKEMGLLDEAIGEFQLASKAPALTVECCSLLGLCFLEKGMPQLAIKWYGKGLAAPGIREPETTGLLYDLARVYQDTGDITLAYTTFLEVYGMNTNYRDVVERVRDLEEARRNSRESVH
ncbi:MAG: tetratricopeptide repeat protein [Acidobacteriota bacterium]